MAKQKEVVAVKEPVENISNAVDALGDVRARKSLLEAKEKDLTTYLKKHAKEGDTLHGKLYEATLTPNNKRVIDVIKAFKKLGKEKFLKICSIAIKEASKVMSDEDIDAMAEVVPGEPSVRTKAKPQMRETETSNMGGAETVEL